MSTARFDILGIGNAIVDVVAPSDHGFLTKHGMHPGSMALIDAARAEELYAEMPAGTETSGGSAANTCAVAASSGTTLPRPACITPRSRLPPARPPRAA